jgi:hypothetical protein
MQTARHMGGVCGCSFSPQGNLVRSPANRTEQISFTSSPLFDLRLQPGTFVQSHRYGELWQTQDAVLCAAASLPEPLVLVLLQ